MLSLYETTIDPQLEGDHLPSETRHPVPVRAVSRALAVLSAVAEGTSPRGESLSLTSQRTGLALSTAYRILAELEEAGYVRRHPVSGDYILGPAVIRLGRIALNQVGLGDAAQAVMQELQRQVGEGVTMAVRSGAAAMYIHQVESSHILRVDLKVGSLVPLHCSAVGKVLLAFQNADDVEDLVHRSSLVPQTVNTITSPEQLRGELELTRTRGYSIDNEEFLPRVRCIGAPIRDDTGAVVAAMAVTGPSERMGDTVMDRIRPLLLAATARVSNLLGCVG